VSVGRARVGSIVACALAAFASTSCTVVRSRWPTAATADPAACAALEHADELIASPDQRQAARGYAIRSVLRVDAGDRVMGLTEQMFAHCWIPVVPVGLVYDLLVLPGQTWRHLSVDEHDLQQASRDIDECRRLLRSVGDDAWRGDRVEIGGSSFVPIDRSRYYVEAAAGER